MKPSRDEHAIVDLVDVLLREGALLQADVVVTVADIPLIGLNLRAALAGMATMTEYGILMLCRIARLGRLNRVIFVESEETEYVGIRIPSPHPRMCCES